MPVGSIEGWAYKMENVEGKGSFRGKCGAFNCNQWGLRGVVILAVMSGNETLPKLL